MLERKFGVKKKKNAEKIKRDRRASVESNAILSKFLEEQKRMKRQM
jgi:hypothetical protein